MTKFEPKDYIALLILGGLILFKMTGHNGSLDLAASVLLGYYFGRRNEVTIQAPKDIELIKPA